MTEGGETLVGEVVRELMAGEVVVVDVVVDAGGY